MTVAPYRCYSCQQPVKNETTVKFCPQCGTQLVLKEKYRLLRVLGRGGFGVVFEGIDTGLDRQLAIKRITANDTMLQQNAVAEARLLSRHARHNPFMPEIYDVWEHGKDVYLAMEYIDGQTLQDVFDKEGPWPAAEVKKFLRSVLGYLAQLHQANVVHRDIKPENIKKTPDGRYVMLDFGIARQSGVTTQKNAPTVIAFTPHYAPLEQEQGLQTDGRSDLYSLGVTAYYLLTGHLPDRSPNRYVQAIPLVPPSKLISNVPRSLEYTILAMLEVLHEKRPKDATVALAMLEDTASTRQPILSSSMNDLVETTRRGGRWLSAMTFSPDGTILAIATYSTIELWDTATWRIIRTIVNHPTTIRSIAFAPDGQSLVAGYDDGKIHIWLLDGKILRVLSGHTARVRALAFAPNGQLLVSGSDDGTLRIWRSDGITARLIQEYKAIPGTKDRPICGIVTVAWSFNGELFASASNEEILVWTKDGDLFTLFRGHSADVNMLTWKNDSTILISASDDGTLRTWSMEQTISRKPFAYHESRVCAVALSPNGTRIVSTTEDGNVCLWREDGAIISNNKTSHSETVAAAWMPDGRMFVTMSTNGNVDLWFSNGNFSQSIQRDVPYTGVLAWSNDGQSFAAATVQKTIHIINTSGDVIRTLQDHTDVITSLTWSPPGEVLLSTSWDRTIRWWSPQGTTRRIFSMQSTRILQTTWSPDGRYIVSIAEGENITIWTTDGVLHREITCPAHSICWHPTNHLFALASDRVFIYRVDGSKVAEIPGKVAAWSPEGKILATGDYRKVFLWDTEGNHLATLTGNHTDWITALAWKPAPDYVLASGGEDGSICLWKATGAFLASLNEHTDWITALTWAPRNGSILASASHDGSIRFWLSDGTAIRAMRYHTENLAWCPDGSAIVTTPGDGTFAILVPMPGAGVS